MCWQLILALTLLIPSFELSSDAAILIIAPLPGTPGQQAPAHSDGSDKPDSSQSPVAPKPNPDASGKYHVGDGVSTPKLLFAPDPEYTEAARRKKVQGKVVLSLTVDIEGKPQNVRVLHSLAEAVSRKLQAVAMGLDKKAVEAAQQYRFDPALFQGKPVPVEIKVETRYRIF